MILIALLKCSDEPANGVSFGAGLFVWLANGRLDWVLKSLFLQIHLEPLMAEIQNTLHLYRRLMLSSVTRAIEGFESPGKVLYKWPGKKLPPWFKLIRNGEITSLGPKHTLCKYVSAQMLLAMQAQFHAPLSSEMCQNAVYNATQVHVAFTALPQTVAFSICVNRLGQIFLSRTNIKYVHWISNTLAMHSCLCMLECFLAIVSLQIAFPSYSVLQVQKLTKILGFWNSVHSEQ